MRVVKGKEPKEIIKVNGDRYWKISNWKSFKGVKKEIGDQTSKTAIAVRSKHGWATYRKKDY